MRTLIVASILAALMLTVCPVHSANPSLIYPAFAPSEPEGTFCYATGAPAADEDQVNLFTVYNCGNSKGKTAHVGYVNLNGPTSQVIKSSGPGANISYHAPLAVGHHRALTWATGDLKDYQIVGLQKPNTDGSTGKVSWARAGTGWAASMPSFSTVHGLVYVAVNESVMALDLNEGTTQWTHSFTGVYSISSVVYFEENNKQTGSVFWVTDTKGTGVPTVHKRDAGKDSTFLESVPNPCNLTAAPSEQFQLELLTFGEDANGPLNGLFFYGNYDPPVGSKFSGPTFVVCRFSHHTLQQEYSWGFSDGMDVHGVTAGDNATIFNVKNRKTGVYEVIILNQTKGSEGERHTLARTVTDVDNNPVIIKGDDGLSPRLVMQRSTDTNNFVVAYDTWMKYTEVAWIQGFGCWLTATVARSGGVDRIFCLSDAADRTATSLDYSGSVIWQLSDVASGFPPVNMANIYVAFQLAFKVVGYSFDPDLSALSGPSTGGGPSGGVIALVIIIIIFLLVLGFIVFKFYNQKTNRRSASRMQLDKEGYAGLNA